MKMTKLLMIAVAVASISACGGGGSSGAPTGSDATTSAPVTNTSPTPADTSNTIDPPTVIDSSSSVGSSTPEDTAETTETPVDSEPDTGSEPDDEAVQVGENETPPPETDPVIDTPPVISLSWTIPAEREDGTYLPVYEIAGYEVRYSRDQSSDVTVIRIDDAQKTDWVIEDVAPGEYQFSIATIDSEGVYSDFSTQATTRVE